MGFSGFLQKLCKSGHLHILDIYEDIEWDNEGPTKSLWKCLTCGADEAWENVVDTTNGSYETHPITGKKIRIDGYIKLEIDKPAKICTCNKCGNQHIIEPATYKIPKKKKK